MEGADPLIVAGHLAENLILSDVGEPVSSEGIVQHPRLQLTGISTTFAGYQYTGNHPGASAGGGFAPYEMSSGDSPHECAVVLLGRMAMDSPCMRTVVIHSSPSYDQMVACDHLQVPFLHFTALHVEADCRYVTRESSLLTDIVDFVIHQVIAPAGPSWKARRLKAQLTRNMRLKHDTVALLMGLFNEKHDILLTHLVFVFLSFQHPFLIAQCRSMSKTRRRILNRKSKLKRVLSSRSVSRGNIMRAFHCCSLRSRPLIKRLDLGGHRKRLVPAANVLPYMQLRDGMPKLDATYSFTFHIHTSSFSYLPSEGEVVATVPVSELLPHLSLTDARQIASYHKLRSPRTLTMTAIQDLFVEHTCVGCHCCVSVFRFQQSRDDKRNTTKRSVRTLLNNAQPVNILPPDAFQAKASNSSNTVYPPAPLDRTTSHKVLTNTCKRMRPEFFEEAGCAVCGQLTPARQLTRLKSVKRLLRVLDATGVTRQERRSATDKIWELTGPVIDYQCNRLCDSCRKTLTKGKVPETALARATGRKKMKAHVMAFETPIPKVYDILPPPREDVEEVLAIMWSGPARPDKPEYKMTSPFLVRRNVVKRALEWLVLNHPDYADVILSEENLSQYQEESPPCTVEYKHAESNKTPEGTSVFDRDEEDGLEGDCAFTVHGLTGERLQKMTTNQLRAEAWKHFDAGGGALSIGHSDNSESIWNNHQLYPKMFPWLFPYGAGGIGSTALSDKRHKSWLLMYHDKQFQKDPNFPFVAFSHAQIKATTTSGFLMAEWKTFDDVTNRLLTLDRKVMNEIACQMAAGKKITPLTDQQKACFKFLSDIDYVAGRVEGSTTTKKNMRHEIWSLISHLGAPSWYITLSPADERHPIAIYFAGSEEKFRPSIGNRTSEIKVRTFESSGSR
ncbi:hypothetical protein D9758_018661 [Tetrapyrgos nigripes]|uniref:Uncharacterized protein n=1 Tax=Tetrapyrgos nigripes TaxID=182062 RepID=A0A8H5EYZ7_9AGAR|nr:hypothetical protein D9758_018661 [Tetrapyrgos nigripes]